jgi:hypothetical protein
VTHVTTGAARPESSHLQAFSRLNSLESIFI